MATNNERSAAGSPSHRSYSQCGEDLILGFLVRSLGIERPSYIDIGAHDPTYLNNTKLLYQRGSRGINIEANPALIQRFKRQRPADINLNIGVVDFGTTGEAARQRYGDKVA